MTTIGQPYTSGNWFVTVGKEDAFIEQWNAVAAWCLANSPGARFFRLIRDSQDSRHFISFGEWDDFESVSVARSRPEFLELFRGCQRLCDEFGGSDFTVVLATPSGYPS